MNAQRAQEIANEYWESLKYNQLTDILEMISLEAKKGMFQLVTDQQLTDGTRDALLYRGYRLKETGEVNKEAFHTVISWKKD